MRCGMDEGMRWIIRKEKDDRKVKKI